jgi:hypothetical protein
MSPKIRKISTARQYKILVRNQHKERIRTAKWELKINKAEIKVLTTQIELKHWYPQESLSQIGVWWTKAKQKR